MSTNKQQQQAPKWWNDRTLFLYHFSRSNYITAITDWFMGLAGKLTELVLYGTVLYSCAQLYPSVTLPASLSLAVFLVQMGALDIGGLSLAKLAKQAREDGNADGARQAEILSRWLIGIMLTGVVTVGIEHVVSLPGQVQTGIEIVLVVARSICAVLYGHVVHTLKSEAGRELTHVVKSIDVHTRLDAFTASLRRQQTQLDTLAGNITLLSSRLDTLSTSLDTLTTSLSTFGTQLTRLDSRLMEGDSHQAKKRQRDTQVDTLSHSDKEEGDSQEGDRGKIISLSSLRPEDTRSRQIEVISYILDFMQREQREPTLSEIMNVTGCAKQTAVNSRNHAREILNLEEESQAVSHEGGQHDRSS